MQNYAEITERFVRYYYQLWNTNQNSIKDLYMACGPSACITYLGNKYNTFDQVLNYLSSVGVKKLTFDNLKFTSQPLGEDKILINISGNVTSNGIQYRKFSETIILFRDIWNKYYISNNIFFLMDTTI